MFLELVGILAVAGTFIGVAPRLRVIVSAFLRERQLNRFVHQVEDYKRDAAESPQASAERAKTNESSKPAERRPEWINMERRAAGSKRGSGR